MNKEQILELVPGIGEEQAEAIVKLFEETAGQAEKAKSKELADAYERGRKEAEAEQQKAEFERLLDAEIEKAGAKNVKAVRALLELDKITAEDGALKGFDEQIKKLKAECAYLFAEDGEKPRFTSAITAGADKVDISKLSYKERLRIYKESPELYKSLVK